MPFQVSPGVNVTEIDLTTVIPAVSTTIGAIAGRFDWGPAGVRVLVDSEDTLARQFWKPNSNNHPEWFTASNFLAYGNALYVSRVKNEANNATSSGNTAVRILNDDDYENNYSTGTGGSATSWVAKYPGSLGNSLKVSICQSNAAWSNTVLSSTFSFTAGSQTVTTSANVGDVVTAGDFLVHANSSVSINVQVDSIAANGTSITLKKGPTTEDLGAASLTTTAGDITRRWEYFNFFDASPGTSTYAARLGGANDEMHIAVIDEDGEITGIKGQVIERFGSVSKASDSLFDDGTAAYYKNVINTRSQWIWWAGHDPQLGITGTPLATDTFTASSTLPQTTSMAGGDNGGDPSNAELINAYDLFESAEDVDVSFLLGADANQTVATHLINNICETRLDCIAVLSPEQADCVNNSTYAGKEKDDIVAFRNTLPSTSYATLDSSWKYQYDKYNDVFRFVPMNGDTAGLMVRTDTTRDPWFSPAGFNRGNIKNVAKLSYNPRKADRDELYKSGINPVVTFPGQGTVLFGDKTLLAKPSAFDRINVRRLFIVLEKAISTAAKFTLFEFNDAFTRAQFRNLVEPFLRDVQGRRGIFDFRVVCDETNNTGEVIDRNEFIGDIYIKPARSINFIQLNFIAVRTGVDFEEVVGKF